MSCIYVSNGNIPSRWAHTFQTMKMAEAYAQILHGFSILVDGHVAERILPSVDLRSFYGLTRDLEIVKLRTQWIRLRRTYEKAAPRRDFLAAALAKLESARPEMVFTRSYEVAEAVIAAGMPLIFETHASPEHAQMATVQKISKAPNLHGVVTTLEYLKEGYVALGVPEEKALAIANGVDLHRFEGTDDDDVALLRRELELPSEGPIVMYTGHLYEHKGVATLLDAARFLPDCHVVLVGGWDEDVARWRAQYGTLGNVSFTGFVENELVARYIRAADVCVVTHLAGDPSSPETCPLKTFEYMAAGRPIVISDFLGGRTIIEHERNGLRFESGDPVALAAAIERLLGDPSLATRLAQQAREDVRTQTWDRRAARILETFAPGLLPAATRP